MSFVARHLLALTILVTVLLVVAVVSVTSLPIGKAFRDLVGRDEELFRPAPQESSR